MPPIDPTTAAGPSHVTQMKSGLIEPVFWTGTPSVDPAEFTIDCSGRDMTKEHPDIIAQMKETFDKVGLVLLKNTGLTKLADMGHWVESVYGESREYDGGANPRNSLEANVYDTGAPKEAWLHYHHEMAYVSKSTTALGFCCDKAPKKGNGATFVSDGVANTEALLKTPFGQKLKEKNICYIRCLTDRESYKNIEGGVYNHWQHSFGTDDMDEAVRKAEERGLRCEWVSDPVLGGPKRYLKTRFYVSAFEYFPLLDKNLLYSSVADDAVWFDTWPGVMELPNHQRPLKVTFGDDTELSEDEIKQWVDVYDNYGVPIFWEQGDIALVCNYRWAHGRPSYNLDKGEERNLGVVLGPVFNRVGHKDDKW